MLGLRRRRGSYLQLTDSSLISYCNSTKDFMVPSLWGQVSPAQFWFQDKQLFSKALIHLIQTNRLKNVTTRTHHSKQTAAVPSCNPRHSRHFNSNHQRGVLWTRTRYRYFSQSSIAPQDPCTSGSEVEGLRGWLCDFISRYSLSQFSLGLCVSCGLRLL